METLPEKIEGIPTGEEKTDIKTREEIITSYYVEWKRNNTEGRVLNDDLKDYIYVIYLSLDETRRHAAKRYLSTLAVLHLDEVLKKAKRIGKPLPIKKGSKNQKGFSKMIHMECRLEGIGSVKLMVGVKKRPVKKTVLLNSDRAATIKRPLELLRGLPYRSFPSNGLLAAKILLFQFTARILAEICSDSSNSIEKN